MRSVFVVTHPEATHHVDGLVGGWYDSQLTPAGLRAAESIAQALKSAVPAATAVQVHSSDLHRAMQTAGAIAAALNTDVLSDAGLREKSYGDADGMPQAWLDERFVPPPAHGDRMRHAEDVRGAETKLAFATRVYASMQAILDAGGEHHVVVTHGFAATFVLAAWIRMPLESLSYVNFRVSAGSITELREDDYFHNRQIVTPNETSHLTASEVS